jgi:hypothetical protein
MKRSMLALAVGLLGVAACSHHDKQANAAPKTSETMTLTTSDTTPRDGTNGSGYVDQNLLAKKDSQSVATMREQVSQLMDAQSLNAANVTAALNAIAAALPGVPDANTGVGADRMKVNIAAIEQAPNDERTPLRVHASLVQAIEALRTVNNPAKTPLVENAAYDLRSVSNDKPIAQQSAALRTTICAVGNAVAVAYDTKGLDCGGATASK